MSLARIYSGATGLGQLIIRALGDVGGAPASRVSEELDQIIAWTAKAWRNINLDTTAVGNVGGGTDDLMTYTVPASTLAATNDALRIRMSGIVSAQDGGAGDTRTIVWSYAGNNIDSRVINATNAQCNWCIDLWIVRISTANTVFYDSTWGAWNSGSDTAPLRSFKTQGTIAATHTNANVLKATGNSSDAVNNDIVQQLLVVDLCNQ